MFPNTIIIIGIASGHAKARAAHFLTCSWEQRDLGERTVSPPLSTSEIGLPRERRRERDRGQGFGRWRGGRVSTCSHHGRSRGEYSVNCGPDKIYKILINGFVSRPDVAAVSLSSRSTIRSARLRKRTFLRLRNNSYIYIWARISCVVYIHIRCMYISIREASCGNFFPKLNS